MNKKITARILRTGDINWRALNYIQQEDFKDLPKETREKLKASLVQNEFVQPFYVWQDPSDLANYCLDGKHRTDLLAELITDGVEVPEMLPAVFIDCKDKQEAAKLVLVYSSVYAKITSEGFQSFISTYELNLDDLKETIDLPGLQDLDINLPSNDPFADTGITSKNQYGVIVMCETEEDQEKA